MAAGLRAGSPSKAASTGFAKDLFATRGYTSRRRKLRSLFSFAAGMRTLTCRHAPGAANANANANANGASCAVETGRVQVDLAELGLASALSSARLRGKTAMRLERSDAAEHAREVVVDDVDEGVLFAVNRTRSAEDGCGTVRFGAAVTGGPAVHCACTKAYGATGTLTALQLACNDTAATTGALAKGDVLRATAFVVQYVDSDAGDLRRRLTEAGDGSDPLDADDDGSADYVAAGGGAGPPAPPPPASPSPDHPPAPPGMKYVTVITHRATVDGDLSDFDATQYRVGLASLLPGVSPNDVRLAVSAGSVVVDATIEVPADTESVPSVDALVDTLSELTANDLAGATGAPVLSLEPPVVTTELAAPLPPPPPAPPAPPPPPPAPPRPPRPPPAPPRPPANPVLDTSCASAPATTLSVRVFEWTMHGGWTPMGSGVPVDDGGGVGGGAHTVALSADGARLAVAVSHPDGARAGHARVHEWNGTAWTPMGAAVQADAGHSGVSAALSADGARLVVGTYDAVAGTSDAGGARVYEWAAPNWVRIDDGDIGGDERDRLGGAISISADGRGMAVTPRANHTSYVRALPRLPERPAPPPPPPPGAPPWAFGDADAAARAIASPRPPLPPSAPPPPPPPPSPARPPALPFTVPQAPPPPPPSPAPPPPVSPPPALPPPGAPPGAPPDAPPPGAPPDAPPAPPTPPSAPPPPPVAPGHAYAHAVTLTSVVPRLDYLTAAGREAFADDYRQDLALKLGVSVDRISVALSVDGR